MIISAHKDLNHRGVEPTYYKIKKEYYTTGLKKSVENIIKKCDVCNKTNRKNKNGHEFVETTKQFEKVEIDLIDIRADKEIYIMVGVDYFTQYIIAEIIRDKKACTVVNVLRKWSTNLSPEEIISDNKKEFCSQEVKECMVTKGIEHRKVAPEAHESNGRIERAIRTIRDGLLKVTKTE